MYVVVSADPGENMTELMKSLTERKMTFMVADDLSKLCTKCRKIESEPPAAPVPPPTPVPSTPSRNSTSSQSNGSFTSIAPPTSAAFVPTTMLLSKQQQSFPAASLMNLSPSSSGMTVPNFMETFNNVIAQYPKIIPMPGDHSNPFRSRYFTKNTLMPLLPRNFLFKRSSSPTDKEKSVRAIQEILSLERASSHETANLVANKYDTDMSTAATLHDLIADHLEAPDGNSDASPSSVADHLETNYEQIMNSLNNSMIASGSKDTSKESKDFRKSGGTEDADASSSHYEVDPPYDDETKVDPNLVASLFSRQPMVVTENGDDGSDPKNPRGMCMVCMQQISLRKHHRKRHVLKHLGLKPYICRLCSKRFNRPDVSRAHFDRCHPNAHHLPFLETGTQEEEAALNDMMEKCFPAIRSRHMYLNPVE